MDKQTYPRAGAASGIIFLVLLMAGNSIFESGNESVGAAMELVGLLFFIPFLGYLWSVLRRAEGEGGWLSATALGAGLVGVTVKLGSAAPVLAARDLQAGTPLYGALQDINVASFNLTMLPFGVMVAAVAIVTLKTRVMPVWLGLMAAVTGPALVVNGSFFDAEFIPAFLLFLLWTVLTSVVLTLRAGRVDAEAASRRETTAENHRSPVREP